MAWKLFIRKIRVSISTGKKGQLDSVEEFLTFLKDDTGAGAVEYAILVAMIAAVIVGAVTLVGGNLKAIFDYVATIFLKP